VSKSDWALDHFDENSKIVFIKDLNLGRMSVTNDAENVWGEIHRAYNYLVPVRIVYLDSDGEWYEMIDNEGSLAFKKWNGLAWDILQR
jgi:hypothetical protein